MRQHIFAVMRGVQFDGKKPYAWDVVNEAVGWVKSNIFNKRKGKNGLKKGVWYPTMPDYVDQAFLFAREADPDALLFYNDK